MDPLHLQELSRLEDNYWWHVAKREIAFDLIERFARPDDLIVEGGVGAAGNLMRLQEKGFRVHGLDVMPEAIEICKRRGVADATQHDLCRQWPIAPDSAKVVLLLDVLEHLQKPVEALAYAADILKPQGKIIVTVPAWPMLFGEWDRRLGHFRRYSSCLLQQHVREAGLRLHWMNSWNAFTLPAALVVRAWRRFFPLDRPAEFPQVSEWMNRWLIRLASLERGWMMRSGRIPTGLSLVAVASKG
jgi:SAM-dependent methyltransferase